jgi:anti-anti-sigma factor
MRASYRVEETEAGTIISVFDDIDLANANLLADALFSLIDTRRGIVVDFRGLRYIDSVGLHILLRAGQRAERLGCDVTVVAVRPIRQLVEQIGLGRLMAIVSDIPPSHQAPKAAAAPDAASRAVRPKTPQPKPGTPGEPKKSTAPSRTES